MGKSDSAKGAKPKRTYPPEVTEAFEQSGKLMSEAWAKVKAAKTEPDPTDARLSPPAKPTPTPTAASTPPTTTLPPAQQDPALTTELEEWRSGQRHHPFDPDKATTCPTCSGRLNELIDNLPVDRVKQLATKHKLYPWPTIRLPDLR